MVYPILPRGQADRWGLVSARECRRPGGRPHPASGRARCDGRTDLRYKRDDFPRGRGAERRFSKRRSILNPRDQGRALGASVAQPALADQRPDHRQVHPVGLSNARLTTPTQTSSAAIRKTRKAISSTTAATNPSQAIHAGRTPVLSISTEAASIIAIAAKPPPMEERPAEVRKHSRYLGIHGSVRERDLACDEHEARAAAISIATNTTPLANMIAVSRPLPPSTSSSRSRRLPRNHRRHMPASTSR